MTQDSDDVGNGWDASAAAWIADMGERGDFSRQFVLDAPMRARVRAAAPRDAVDIGCGEGRFTRWMRAQGISAVGLDPTAALLAEAQRRDAGGDYRQGAAEALPFSDATFDLAVFYLTLIDIDDVPAALAEATRVLRPGGRVLIANLLPHATAATNGRTLDSGARRVTLDRYLQPHCDWYEWRGIRIRNWHRPLSACYAPLLAAGLHLTFFDEPSATGGPPWQRQRYNAAPFHYIMEWRKPG